MDQTDASGRPHSHRLRIGRFNQSGGIYLLTASCHGRIAHLAEPVAAGIVLDTLHWLDREGRIELMAAVVMPDHCHFVAAPLQPPLDKVMHSLKSYSAQRINEASGRDCRIWQPGYHDHALRTEEKLRVVIEYCVQNPQRAGLVADYHEYPHLWCRWPL